MRMRIGNFRGESGRGRSGLSGLYLANDLLEPVLYFALFCRERSLVSNFLLSDRGQIGLASNV